MWPFYGTKRHLAPLYPGPKYGIIIEPFAGAAQYSMYEDNWKKQVYLIDKDPKIVSVWQYLKAASPASILKLPDMYAGDSVNNFTQLSPEERWLIGYCINPGSSSPKITARASGNWSLPQAGRPSLWNRYKLEIADNLYKIRHWTICLGNYDYIHNPIDDKFTWFIDPPYQFGGQYYRYGNSKINYSELAEWCKLREGQVIVCENSKANWLPFTPLAELNGQLHKTMEVIYTQG
jgi:site-specific DNA-adenine methylase